MTHTRVTIHELTGERRTWTSRHRTADHATLRGLAVRRAFGATHGFKQDSGLPAGYGSVIRTLSRDERGSGSTWAAEVVIGRARLDVVPERPAEVVP
jgi:hypothetical protein